METKIITTAYDLLLKKLFSLKEQITFQSTITDLLSKDIDSIKLLFEAVVKQNESLNRSNETTSQTNEATTQTNDSTNLMIGSLMRTIESINLSDGAMNQMVEALTQNIDSMKQINGAVNQINESMSLSIEAKSQNAGALTSNTVAKTNSTGSTIPKEPLAKLIIKSASEKIKLSFYFDNIPNRLAGILLAMSESKKLRVAEMQKLSGASRNSTTRDVAILKKLGWIKFNGGKSNGYFSLTEEGEKAIKEIDHG